MCLTASIKLFFKKNCPFIIEAQSVCFRLGHILVRKSATSRNFYLQTEVLSPFIYCKAVVLLR